MRYVSTRDNSKEYNFEEVFIKGLADDGGLYVPTSLKKFSLKELSDLKNLNYNDLSTEIINQFSSDFISKDDLSSLIKKSYSTFRENDVVKISNSVMSKPFIFNKNLFVIKNGSVVQYN